MRALLKTLEHKKTLRCVIDEKKKLGLEEGSEALERIYNYIVNLVPSIFCIQVNFRGDIFTGPYGYVASFDGSLPYQNEIFNGKQLYRCISVYEVKENNALRSDLKSKSEAQINCRKVLPLSSRFVPRLSSGDIRDTGHSGWHESLSCFNSRIFLCESEEQLPNDITKLKRMWIVVENTLPEETLNELCLFGYFLKSNGYNGYKDIEGDKERLDDDDEEEDDDKEEGIVTYKRVFDNYWGNYNRARQCAIENNNRLAITFAEALGVNFKDSYSNSQRITHTIMRNTENTTATTVENGIIEDIFSASGNEDMVIPRLYDSAENGENTEPYYVDLHRYYTDRGHKSLEEFIEKERDLLLKAVKYWPSRVTITPVSVIPRIYTEEMDKCHTSAKRCIPAHNSLSGWRIGYYCYALYNYKNINSPHKKLVSDTIEEFEKQWDLKYNDYPRTIKPAIVSFVNDIKWEEDKNRLIYYDSCVCTYTPRSRIGQTSNIKVEGVCVPLHCREGYDIINSSLFEREERYNSMCSMEWKNDYLDSYPAHYRLKEIPSISGIDHLNIETEIQDTFFSQTLFGISTNKEGDIYIPSTHASVEKDYVPNQLKYIFDEGLFETCNNTHIKKQLYPINTNEIARKTLKPLIGYIPD